MVRCVCIAREETKCEDKHTKCDRKIVHGRRGTPAVRIRCARSRAPEKILSHQGRHYHPYDRTIFMRWTACPFPIARGRNPRSGGRIRLRQIDDRQTARRPGKADGRQAVYIMERIWRSFEEKEMKSMRTQLQMVFQDPYSSLNPQKAYL